MKINKWVLFLFILLLIILLAIVLIYYFKNNYVNESIIKTAVHKKDLENTNYILCKRIYVTGFDWVTIANHEEENLYELCNIVNIDPFNELNLTYEFFLGQNTFIFYVEERKEYDTEELGKCVDYVVSGWDILFPVKREHFFIFKSNKYILKSDTNQ